MEKTSILGNRTLVPSGLSAADLASCVTDQARSLLSYQHASDAKILPLGVVELAGRAQVLVAASDTGFENQRLIKYLLNGKEPYLVEVAQQTIQEAIFIAYHRQASRIEKALTTAELQQEEPPSKTLSTLRDIKTPENDLICGLLDYSVAWDASDLHIVPNDQGLIISMRIGGELKVRDTQVRNNSLYNRVIQRFKVLSKLDITQKNAPQEGSFEIPLAHGAVSARVSIVPSVFGESLSIRFFKKAGMLFLSSIGYDEIVENQLRDILCEKSGILIVCGPTGAGKTTVVYALTRELLNKGKRVISIEDPVETVVSGMTQIQVSDDKKITFESGLKAILRQDPDVIVVGEVREGEVAKIMIQAGLSGHLVLSTMHAGSVEEAKMRLMDWGISQVQIQMAVKGILFQRLNYHDQQPTVDAVFSAP